MNLSTPWLLLLAIALLVAALVPAIADEGEDDDIEHGPIAELTETLGHLSYSMQDAIDIALAEVPGIVLEAATEIDDDFDGVVYEIAILTMDDSAAIMEVVVDADDGAVLEIEDELNDTDDEDE